MQRLTPTRSLATGVMAVALDLFVGLVVTMPVTHVRPMTVFYVALIIIGTGMLLRERIFPPARVQAAVPARAQLVPERTPETAYELVGSSL